MRLDILGILVICGGYVALGGNARWAVAVCVIGILLSELLLRTHRWLEVHPTRR